MFYPFDSEYVRTLDIGCVKPLPGIPCPPGFFCDPILCECLPDGGFPEWEFDITEGYSLILEDVDQEGNVSNFRSLGFGPDDEPETVFTTDTVGRADPTPGFRDQFFRVSNFIDLTITRGPFSIRGGTVTSTDTGWANAGNFLAGCLEERTFEFSPYSAVVNQSSLRLSIVSGGSQRTISQMTAPISPSPLYSINSDVYCAGSPPLPDMSCTLSIGVLVLSFGQKIGPFTLKFSHEVISTQPVCVRGPEGFWAVTAELGKLVSGGGFKLFGPFSYKVYNLGSCPCP